MRDDYENNMAPMYGNDANMNDMLEDLENVAHIPARQRSVKINNLVDRVCSKAYEDGLDQASLSHLIDIITVPNELDQRSMGSLIKNLYPATKIPDSDVIKVVNSLGHGQAKPSLASQGALLKWLVMVYDVLENRRILSKLYPILFNLLDTIAIRVQLCHLLSLITRRTHVRSFRIQSLMELTRQAGNEPALVGLMRVYKDYYPDVIVGAATSGRASVFTHPNPEWRQRLGEIQHRHFQKQQDGLPPGERGFKVLRNGANETKSKGTLIPEVHTSHAHASSITLEEIGSVEEFVQKLEKIAIPNQIVAVIRDPLLQKYLQLNSSTDIERRIDNWLLTFFEDHIQTTGSEGRIVEMLEAILDYTQFTKQMPTACLTYLTTMLPTWNGVAGRHAVLGLLAYVPPRPYEALRQTIFEPLEEALLDGCINSQIDLLTFYNNILDRWILQLTTQSQPSSESAETIKSLLTHVNSLALSILQSSTDLHAHSQILRFYETFTSLITHPSLGPSIYITIPPAALIYTIQFTQSITTLSRLCSILASYKRAFTPASDSTQPISYDRAITNHFNGYLMDVCNCLWRSRAFNTSDPNAMGCLVNPSISTELSGYIASLSAYPLTTLFSLSHSPVICTFGIAYVRELEDAVEEDIETRHAGPVTQTSLGQLGRDGGLKLSWMDYRLGVLTYLEGKGIAGIGELMYNTMKHLMAGREKVN